MAFRSIMRVIVIIVILLVIAVGALSWIFSSKLAYPPRYRCTDDREHELYVFCGDPSELGLAFEEVELINSDGLLIRGWYIPAPDSRKAILFAHGRSAGRWAAMRYAQALNRAGYALLTFDFRGHGANEHSPVSMGYHEKKEIFAALDYLIHKKGMKAVGIVGFSMGAATAVLAMAEDDRISAGIFESGYANFTDLIATVARRDFHLPRYPVINTVMILYELRFGLDIDKMNPEDVIGSIAPRPVYIIHGTDDRSVHPEHARRLYRAARDPKRIWWVQGGKHVNSWNADRRKAERSMIDFFNRHL
jgi:fermentation-respiration switch protein FrsA (DUF1100 family)